MMADLPLDRVTATPPFLNTGLDVMGPWTIHDGTTTRRQCANKKSWAVLFTCLYSRAVHIELLPYLDTSSMKNAIRRFQAIRGHCQLLRSDRGTNFIATSNELDMEKLSSDIENDGCRWEFNPPNASHFGGAWERKIGQIKRAIDSSFLQLKHKSLSRDELATFLQEATAIVNSTPMWELSQDPNETLPLTPAMLLTSKEKDPQVSETFTEDDLQSYGRKRWRRVQYLAQEFWNSWKTFYLQNLQIRQKWIFTTRCLEQGDVVLVKDKNAPRKHWPIGVITSTKKSADGLVRSATVKTCKANSTDSVKCSILERPITSFVLLFENRL
jgi:hypothetical protein